jgi:hypothetical protein
VGLGVGACMDAIDIACSRNTVVGTSKDVLINNATLCLSMEFSGFWRIIQHLYTFAV